MKFMIPFLIAMLPVASVAQSQSGAASGVPRRGLRFISFQGFGVES
jgi:hypothetical protein